MFNKMEIYSISSSGGGYDDDVDDGNDNNSNKKAPVARSVVQPNEK